MVVSRRTNSEYSRRAFLLGGSDWADWRLAQARVPVLLGTSCEQDYGATLHRETGIAENLRGGQRGTLPVQQYRCDFDGKGGCRIAQPPGRPL